MTTRGRRQRRAHDPGGARGGGHRGDGGDAGMGMDGWMDGDRNY